MLSDNQEEALTTNEKLEVDPVKETKSAASNYSIPGHWN